MGTTEPPAVVAPIWLARGLRKAIVLLIVCVAFAIIGVLMIRDGQTAGYFVGSVFGVGALVAAINLHPGGSYLELGREGFTVCSLFRRSFVPWHHVQAFAPIRMHANAMVGWNYTPAFAGSSAARQTSLALAGVEAALPDTYGMKAPDLALVMNRLLADASSNARGRDVAADGGIVEPPAR